MRLTLYTDYSLRVLIFLASKPKDELSNIKEIADAYSISKNHLMKVTYELGKMGMIETIRGRNGGIRLAQSPEDINIGKLVRATEEDFHLVECFDAENNSCIITPVCGLKHVLGKALNAYLSVLDDYTLSDLIQNPMDYRFLFQEKERDETST
ncbi:MULTISPECIES: Rrf2 family transcriptional regulator [Rossellomorea]|jgi:Rrf2 family transcriptional regulator, nitric oxide-sensitive transcriptional repressor|uniref:HTH-type transcriptional regulator NsrR n=2 Tax=Rossellomorea vietnamensis TaxID=218284 RepID=A0A6I6UBS5_9BACI|nr:MULTISPECIES: Rrf2 family transcriptional regulator [Rossellomorea]OXS64358.1 Rrf2 family transcriptional regulator [Bacillus sp. DSM 27956]PRX79495.1 BadM/Rrf2 family transcriptional regulator [Bacillus sp. V-88]MCA0149988.1 Rrf2 family transcriptional regulator [Rossellomorea vietnamensis]QHE60144.1 Rrf2 family transcriptional regulator [Rossellomorea vietnamensis]UTE78233.1 Rrf2 family transcriptional regulator [Rossellomorea sp. KS-H15a]